MRACLAFSGSDIWPGLSCALEDQHDCRLVIYTDQDVTNRLQHDVHARGVPVAAKTTHASTFNTRNVAAHGCGMIGRI